MTTDDVLLEYKDHIIKHTTDGEEGFNAYLESSHVNVITEDFICLYVLMNDFILLYYMEAFNRKGYKHSAKFAKELYKTCTLQHNLPIFYEGKNNVCRNNSKEIKPGVYQFIPKEYHIK